MSKYSILAARLEKDLTQINRAVEAAISQANKAQKMGDLDYLQAAALSLQNFYMGVERTFEEIAKQIDQFLPVGSSSHRDLLEQMMLNIADVRPFIIDSETFKLLNEYRGFRHVAIHRYGFELYPERIRELVTELPKCYQLYEHSIQNFCRFLLDLDKSLT